MQPKILTCIAISALAGCGSSDPPAPESAPPAADTSAQLEPTVFDPLTSTLERAQGVQQTLDETAAARRRALEQAE